AGGRQARGYRRSAGRDRRGQAACACRHGDGPAMTLASPLLNPVSPVWRWASARLWWMEHAFERARASGKVEDDTRLRIFFVLVLFAAGFLTLAMGATRAALFSGLGAGAELLWVPP